MTLAPAALGARNFVGNHAFIPGGVVVPEDVLIGVCTVATAAEKRPGTPVLYTTARTLTDGMKAVFVEPNGYLGKPFTDDQLIQSIATLLRLPKL